MRWYKIIVIIVLLAITILSALFYLNMLLIEKYDFAAGVDKVVSISVEDRLNEILMVQNFLRINITLSIIALALILFVKFAKRKSINKEV